MFEQLDQGLPKVFVQRNDPTTDEPDDEGQEPEVVSILIVSSGNGSAKCKKAPRNGAS
jgi:hypothetical protein